MNYPAAIITFLAIIVLALFAVFRELFLIREALEKRKKVAVLLEHAEPETKEAFRTWVESLKESKQREP